MVTYFRVVKDPTLSNSIGNTNEIACAPNAHLALSGGALSRATIRYSEEEINTIFEISNDTSSDL
jgi:hypothetical protein